MWVATAVFVAMLIIFMIVAVIVIFMFVAVFNFAHGDVVTNHEDVAA